MNCRLVYKKLVALTSTLEFAELHRSRLPTACLIIRLYQRCILKPLSKGLHLADLDCVCILYNKLGFIPDINLPNVSLGLINSCNGLVCLSQLFYHDSSYACNICVCNLVLKAYITILKHPHVNKYDSYKCAFEFSHKTNQYKMVLCSDLNTFINSAN